MSAKFDPELISAAFDGEASPAEQSRIAAELAADSGTGNAQREYERLRHLLQELPPQQAPEHLRLAVMQQLEREVLLGDQAAPPQIAQTTPSPSAKAPRSFARQAGVVIATGLALSLTLAILMDSLNSGKPEDGRGQVAQHDVPEAAAEEAAVSNRSSVAPADSRDSARAIEATESVNTLDSDVAESVTPRSGFGPPQPMASPGALNQVTSEDAAGGLESLNPFGGNANSPRSLPRQAAGANASGGRAEFVQSFDLGEAQVGDIVESIERHGNDVKVVRLVVVDRMRGLEQLQLLLAKQVQSEAGAAGAALEADESLPGTKFSAANAPAPGASTTARPDTAQSKAGLTAADKPSAAQQVDDEAASIVAVLVDLPDDQLTAMVKELQESKTFQELVVEEPVSGGAMIAAAESASRMRISGARNSAGGGLGGGGFRGTQRNAIIVPRTQAGRDSVAQPAPTDRVATEDAASQPAGVSGPSQPYRLIDERVLTQTLRQRAVKDQPALTANADSRPALSSQVRTEEKPTPAAEVATESRIRMQPRKHRVLFYVMLGGPSGRSNAPAESPPATAPRPSQDRPDDGRGAA